MHIITEDMIDNLAAMLLSEDLKDQKLAMSILNNRDTDNEKSESNVLKIRDKYLEVKHPSSFKIIKENEFKNRINIGLSELIKIKEQLNKQIYGSNIR